MVRPSPAVPLPTPLTSIPSNHNINLPVTLYRTTHGLYTRCKRVYTAIGAHSAHGAHKHTQALYRHSILKHAQVYMHRLYHEVKVSTRFTLPRAAVSS